MGGHFNKEDFNQNTFDSLKPKFLEWQLDKSRKNMNLETIDCAMIQYPHEAHFIRLGEKEFKN